MDDIWRVEAIVDPMDLRGITRRIVEWDMPHHLDFQSRLRERLDRHDEDHLLDTEESMDTYGNRILTFFLSRTCAGDMLRQKVERVDIILFVLSP